MPKTKLPKFSKVSEWIAAGHMATGLTLLEPNEIRKETPNALCLPCFKFNSAGNQVPGECWIPKSILQSVEDDHYFRKNPIRPFLIPSWFVTRKYDTGFILLDPGLVP